jgi:hypothetical protein
MQNKQDFTTIIQKAVKDYNLYGSSFTYGMALYELVTRGRMDERLDAYGLYDRMTMCVGEDLIEMMESRGLDTSMRCLANILDIAMIQEIVESIIEEEDEE